MGATRHLTIETLDQQIRRVLLARILSGELIPDANINEAELAEELGASRTPLRQALVRLEQEGFVYARPNRGFFVTPLTLAEARELYPLLSTLECLGLREAPPDGDGLRDLERLNERLGALAGDDPSAAVEANMAWHEALLARSENSHLRRLLDNLRQQVFRYEVSFFSPGAERLRTSMDLHRGVMEALDVGDLDLACERLDRHWLTDLEELAPE